MAANEYFNANPNNQQTTNALNRQLMGGMSPVASPSQAGGGSAAYLPGTGGNYAGMSGGSGMSGATSYGQQVASAVQGSGAGAMAGASAGKTPAAVANGNSYATALQQAAQPFGGTGAAAAAPAASTTPTLEQLYALALESQKAQLAQDQAGLQAAYDRQRQDINDQYNADMIRQAVENQKANLNWNEVQQAYGLSSGTMGQAWLARNNRAQADQTALQAARDKALANIALEQQTAEERYKAELRAAIAQNDYEKAKALYEQALNGGATATGGSSSGGSSSGRSGSRGTTRAYIGSGDTGGYYDLIHGPGAWEEAQAQAKAQSTGSGGRARTSGKSSKGSSSEPEATATGAELAGRVQATMDKVGQANAQQNYTTWYNGLNDWQKAALMTYTEAYNQGKITAAELNSVMAGMGAP